MNPFCRCRRFDEHARRVEQHVPGVFGGVQHGRRQLFVGDGRIPRKIALDGRENGFLIIPHRLVARNPRLAQFFEDSRDILMLEFDRALGPANLLLERRIVAPFHIGSLGKLRLQHGEVVGDDGVQFVIAPVRPDFTVVRRQLIPAFRRFIPSSGI